MARSDIGSLGGSKYLKLVAVADVDLSHAAALKKTFPDVKVYQDWREMLAKAVCASCPVIDNCLRWALAAREPYGVWGGLSTEEREALLTFQPA